ncbi:DUF998 domain-containing protein [Streptomyces laculatispora]|uniref:DUF998 domain-containing protein n=1 Tax=Streptomyces laculatispora TaxID=887464 RepID=A0ABY9I7F8_9ACTN|nr:DUF998 domain-containing protein [Streptomyces laculatispora]WLQ42147.1 DUF998 domain-containing protein [Streptomyces laculatispora]
MTQTLNTRRSEVSSQAVSPSASRRLSAGAVLAGPLFLGAGIVQGFAREGFDFTRNAISQLALGDLGWIQTVSFLLTGALLLLGAAGLRRVLRPEPGGTWGPALIAVFGASFLAAAAFRADPGGGFPVGSPDVGTMSAHGAGHMTAGGIGYLALSVALLVLARPLAARGHRGWALASRIAPVVVLTGFMASAASVLVFTLGAGSGLCWLAAVVVRLLTDASPDSRPAR